MELTIIAGAVLIMLLLALAVLRLSGAVQHAAEAMTSSFRDVLRYNMLFSADQREALRYQIEADKTELLLRERRAKDRPDAPVYTGADEDIDHDRRAVFDGGGPKSA